MRNSPSFRLIFIIALISHSMRCTSRAFYLSPPDQDSSSGDSGDGSFDDEMSGSGIIDPEEECKRKMDIAFVLDSSDSVGPVGFTTIKEYTKQILDRLTVPECDNVGLIKFCDFANSEIVFSSHFMKADIIERIDDLEGPRRYLESEVNQSRVDLALLVADEIVFTKQLGLRESSEKILVVLTDGNTRQPSIDEEGSSEKLAMELGKKGIKIFVLAIGNHESVTELLKIAPDERNIFPEGRVDDLVAALLHKEPSAVDDKFEDIFPNARKKTDGSLTA